MKKEKSFNITSYEHRIEGIRFREKIEYVDYKKEVSRKVILVGDKKDFNIGMDFFLSHKNGVSTLGFKKKSYGAKFYTPQTLFMESDDEVVSFLNERFDAGDKNIIIFDKYVNGTVPNIVIADDGSEIKTAIKDIVIEFAPNVNFETLKKTHNSFNSTLFSQSFEGADTIVQQSNDNIKIDQTSKREEESAFSSVLEKMTILEYSRSLTNKFFQKNSDSLGLSANTALLLSKNNIDQILSSLFAGEEPSVEAEKNIMGIFGISNPAEVQTLIECLISKHPLRELNKAVGGGVINSYVLSDTLSHLSKNSACYIDATHNDIDSIAEFVSNGDLMFLKRVPMATPAQIKQAVAQHGLSYDDFLFPFADGDEQLGLNLNATCDLLSTGNLFGTFGAAAIQKNAILSVGYNEHLIDLMVQPKDRVASKYIKKMRLDDQNIDEVYDAINSKDYCATGVKSDTNPNEIFIFAHKLNYSRIEFENGSVPMSTADKKAILDALPSVSTINSFISDLFSTSPSIADSTKKSFLEVTNAFSFSLFNKANTSEAFRFFRENVAKNTPIYEVRSEKAVLIAINNVDSLELAGHMSISDVSISDKIFPDILNPNSKNLFSIKDIAQNPILITKYLQIPGYSETITHLLEVNKFPVSTAAHFLLDLIEPTKNILPFDKRDLVISNTENMGILNYKYMPPFIDISTSASKGRFIELIASTIAEEGLHDEKEIEEIKADFVDKISGGHFLVLKSRPTYAKDTKTFFREEVMTVANKKLEDVATLGMPPLRLFESLKKEGLLNIEDRTSSVEMKRETIAKIFLSIADFTDQFFSKYSDAHIDEKTLSYAKKLAGIQASTGKGGLSEDGKLTIYTSILKDKGISDIAKGVLGSRKDPKEVSILALKDASEIGATIVVSQEIQKIEDYLDAHFYGKESAFVYGKESASNKTNFDAHFHDVDYGEPLWERMSDVASYDKMLYTATIKIFEMIALRELIGILKQNDGVSSNADIKVKNQNNIINAFLVDCLGLSTHQFREVKGFVSLNLEGQKDVELLFWEMRTGKTRAMIATQLLLSMVKKEDSVLFVQNKNFDDIIMQAWDMNPLIISEKAVFIGEQKRFNVTKLSSPIPLSKNIFPNIPTIIKKELVNSAQGAIEPPAELLSKTFTSDFNLIHSSIIKNHIGVEELSVFIAEKHGAFIGLLDSQVFKREDEISSVAISSIYYLLKLAEDGYLEINTPVLKKIKKSIFEGFFKSLSAEADSYNAKPHGSIIFAGKQFIDSFSAKEEITSPIIVGNKTSLFSPIQFSGITPSCIYLPSKFENVSKKDGAVLIAERNEKIEGTLKKYLLDKLETPYVISDLCLSRKSIVPFIVTEEDKGRTKHGSRTDIVSNMVGDKISNKISTNMNEFSKKDDWLEILEGVGFDAAYASVFGEIGTKIRNSLIRSITQAIEGSSIQATAETLPYPSFVRNSDSYFSGTVIDTNMVCGLGGLLASVASMYTIADQEGFTQWFLENIINEKEISEIISLSGYQFAVSTLMQGNISPMIESRTALVFGTSQKTKDVAFTLDLSHGEDAVIAPIRTALDGGKQSLLVEVTKLKVKTNSSTLPHIFKDAPSSPRQVEYSFSANGSPSLSILKSSSIFQEGEEPHMVVASNLKLSKSITSSFFWDINKDVKIAATAIDEGHKNTGTNKGFQTKGLLDALSNSFPGSAKIIGTGTPIAGLKNFSKLIETIFELKDSRFSNTIQKYCGNFRFKDDFTAELYKNIASSLEFESLIANGLYDIHASLASIDFDNLDADRLLRTSSFSRSFSAIWQSSEMVTSLREASDAGDFNVNEFEAKNAYSKFMHASIVEYKSMLKISRKGLLALTDDEPAEENLQLIHVNLREAIHTACNKSNSVLTSQAPGFSNPIGLSSLLSFLHGANASIRRPSNDIKYSVLDYNHLIGNEPKEKIDINSGSIGPALLSIEFLARRYNQQYHIASVKNTLTECFALLATAVRSNPLEYNIDGVQSASRLLNRSQSSVVDSAEDIYSHYLNNREFPDFSFEKIDIVKFILSNMDTMFSQLQLIRDDLREALKNDEEYLEVDLNGTKFTFSSSDLNAVSFAYVDISGEHIGFGSYKGDAGISLRDGYPMIKGEFGIEKPIYFRVPFQVSLDDRLPSVDVNYNFSNRDDRSIIETLAFMDDTNALTKKHVGNGENIRIMTTRISITKAAIVGTISTLLDRNAETKNTINIVINATDPQIEILTNQILSSVGDALSAAAIRIWAATPNTINMIFNEINEKKEQIVVIGNYESLAEGYNMEFVDTGIYLGAIDKTASAIQSFARQIGYTKKESSFYLCNGGNSHLYSAKLASKKSKQDTLALVESMVNVNIDKNSASAIYSEIKSGLVHGDFQVGKSYISSINNARFEELLAYEHFMNGTLFKDKAYTHTDVSTWGAVYSSNEDNNAPEGNAPAAQTLKI